MSDIKAQACSLSGAFWKLVVYVLVLLVTMACGILGADPTPTSAPVMASTNIRTPDPTADRPGSGDRPYEVTLNSSPQPTYTPQPTYSPEPTTTPQATASPEPTPTPEPTATPQATASPEPTTTPQPTATPEQTATPDPCIMYLLTGLQEAFWYGVEATRCVIALGKEDVNAKDDRGSRMLYWAIANDDAVELVRLLFETQPIGEPEGASPAASSKPADHPVGAGFEPALWS